MKKMHSRGAFGPLALCFAAACSIVSCTFPHSKTLVPQPFNARPTGTDLAVTARFLEPRDDVPGFFRTQLVDSGIVALRVVLRDDGPRPFLVHSANGMGLGAQFEGIALMVDGTRYVPVSPRRAAEMLVGIKKTARYKPAGAFQIVTGTFLVPLGGYYLYNEMEVGRYYKPLFKNSLYPACASGMMEPVRLKPGEEKSGYLYFAMAKPAEGARLELVVRACTLPPDREAVAGYDFRFARCETLSGAADSVAPGKPPAACCDAPYGFLFKLAKASPAGVAGLYAAAVSRLAPCKDLQWTLVAPILSQGASIADASCCSSIAACAVNFRSKSRVFVVRCGGEMVSGEQSFSRAVKRIFASERGVLVITEDDFGYFMARPSLDVTRSVRLGRDIDDAALVDTSLFVFTRGTRLDVVGASGRRLLEPLEEHAVRAGARSSIGFVNGELLVLNKGSRAWGDTIAVFDVEHRAERRRFAFPGKVRQAATDGRGVLVELEDGTLLRMVPAPLGKMKIAGAAYLPFAATTLEAAGDACGALDELGACALGLFGDYAPGRSGVLEISVAVP